MIAIVTDSTCDVPKEMAAQRKIHVVPQHIVMGTKDYLDQVELDTETFYRRLPTEPTLPKTAQVTPKEFIEQFEKAREAANAEGVLVITISSKTSGTYESALQAAKMVDYPVRVVDSHNVTMGEGWQCIKAADLRDQGMKLEQIGHYLDTNKDKFELLFTVATLDYLHKGGRIGRAKHLVGSMLQIKPIMHMEDGAVHPIESVRTRSKALKRLTEIAKEKLSKVKVKRVAVLHGAAQEEADQIAADLQAALPLDMLVRGMVCSAVGVHTGPGVIGIAIDMTA